ncbi:MAG TPA: rRNA maturation RNase YbeY [Chitinophagaceae bacterium]|jgi:rRNA maturation RNase YbeY|nr:rRNA maturation RNase YbeY [Chitinophagaceae bacterium]
MAKEQKPPIYFVFNDVTPILRNRKKLKGFINRLFQKEGKRINHLNYIFCSDQALLQINWKYLNHDFYTDVISFNLSHMQSQIIAEVYISLDRVKENAKIFKTTIQDELHRVIFHGTLHLCGYKDKTQKEIKIMRDKENELLQNYFIT